MPELLDANVVFVGGQPQVSQLDLRDFEFLGATAEERIRLPIALQLVAGPFRLEMMPERSSVGLSGQFDATHRSALVANAEVLLKDYLGRKSVTAVGLNFTFGLAPDLDGSLTNLLLNADAVRSIFDETSPIQSSVTFSTSSVDGCNQRVNLAVGDDKMLRADLNYHFVIGPDSPSSVGVLAQHEAIMDHAGTLVQRVAEWLGI